ncbi:MAG: hypothetical protein WBM46_00510 [Polyangiales bacterium]|jgi:hypothetical protein
MAKGALSMLRRAAKGTSWSQFLDYASPALFDVMPMRALFAQGREFISNGSDAGRFARTCDEIALLLAERGVAVQIGAPVPSDEEQRLTELPESSRRRVGQHVLEIYFGQVFAGDHAVLDLRADAFATGDADVLLWRPRAFYVQWQPDFLDGLRALYAGFYKDDTAQFERGLAQLGLEDSGEVLLSHLGSGDQRKVRFETSAFHSSFHETFLSCRDKGVALHRNFLALGIYLVCLYEVLESLGLEFDVRDAFERIQV